MSCQIGALDEREVHSIGEQLTSISGSMFSPELIIRLYGCVSTRFLLREALNKDCLCTGFHAALAGSFQRSLFAARAHRVACSATPLTSSHTPSGTSNASIGKYMSWVIEPQRTLAICSGSRTASRTDASTPSQASATGLSMFGLLDYRGWPHCRLHSPRAERMTEKSAVTPSAMSVQTKKKAPLDLAKSPPTPFPIMWRTGMPDPRSDPRRMMTYPDRRSASTSVPYSQTTRISTPKRFETRPEAIPRMMSSVR